jgi:hypothetical protein
MRKGSALDFPHFPPSSKILFVDSASKGIIALC